MSDTTYIKLLTHLRNFLPPLLPPGKPHDPALTAEIASLQLHPTLEAALHILNLDLPSAHFLVRHMQSPPAVEGMLLHGILHRVEGDFENARAWYGDVFSDEEGMRLTEFVWTKSQGATAKERALAFVREVEWLSRAGVDETEREGMKKKLGARSREEIESVVEWCEKKFGKDRWVDASAAWVRPDEKIKQMGKEQVSGTKGMRKF